MGNSNLIININCPCEKNVKRRGLASHCGYSNKNGGRPPHPSSRTHSMRARGETLGAGRHRADRFYIPDPHWKQPRSPNRDRFPSSFHGGSIEDHHLVYISFLFGKARAAFPLDLLVRGTSSESGGDTTFNIELPSGDNRRLHRDSSGESLPSCP